MKNKINLLLFLFFSFLLVFAADGNRAQAKPSWCNLPRNNVLDWGMATEEEWESRCVRDEPAPSSDWSIDAGAGGGDPNAQIPGARNNDGGMNVGVAGGYSGSEITGYLDEVAGATGIPDAPGGIEDVLTNFLSWALGIFGILAVLAFVISGVMYLISTGNPQRIDKAKAAMTWSIVGVAVGLIGVIVIQTIDALLNAW